jgi:single-stranded-DNA-specific exonuclease
MGIKSLDHVAYAKERNIDFIICDQPGQTWSIAVLDPKETTVIILELCGCGMDLN